MHPSSSQISSARSTKRGMGLLRRSLSLVFALGLTACAGATRAPTTVPVAPPEPKPPRVEIDLSAALHLTGQYGVAQACPVSEDQALTSGHVLRRETAAGEAVQGYSFSTEGGQYGEVIPFPCSEDKLCGLYYFGDLAVAIPFEGQKFNKFYEKDPDMPSPGDEVEFIGYDWRHRNDALATRVWITKILRIVGRMIILKDDGDPGSSGSCVWSLRTGKVVGINDWGFPLDDGSRVGLAFGLWKGKK